ncbi:MAG: hypothetical protein ACPLZ9_05655 [Candidatus Ratteibacteria bacterium]|jgi:translation initiation factor IF-1
MGKYDEIQDEIDMENIPIKILSKNKLKVMTDQGEKIVTREDVENFHVNMSSGFATLGEISGDWRAIRDIAEACKYVFKRIDDFEK